MRTSNRLLGLLFGTAILLAAQLAHADATSDASTAIQGALDQMHSAFAAKDAARFLEVLDTDYTETNLKGKVSKRAEIEQMLPTVLSMLVSHNGKTTVLKLTLKGGQAIVRADERVEVTLKHPKTGETQTSKHKSLEEQTWRNNGKRWVMVRTRTISKD